MITSALKIISCKRNKAKSVCEELRDWPGLPAAPVITGFRQLSSRCRFVGQCWYHLTEMGNFALEGSGSLPAGFINTQTQSWKPLPFRAFLGPFPTQVHLSGAPWQAPARGPGEAYSKRFSCAGRCPSWEVVLLAGVRVSRRTALQRQPKASALGRARAGQSPAGPSPRLSIWQARSPSP